MPKAAVDSLGLRSHVKSLGLCSAGIPEPGSCCAPCEPVQHVHSFVSLTDPRCLFAAAFLTKGSEAFSVNQRDLREALS